MDESIAAFITKLLQRESDPAGDYQDTLNQYMNARNMRSDEDFLPAMTEVPEARIREMLGANGFGNFNTEDNANIKDARGSLDELLRSLVLRR